MLPAACLRIHGGAGGSAQEALVAQTRVMGLIDRFLERHWSPPRRFAQLTACAFLLTGPGAMSSEVAALAAPVAALERSLTQPAGAGISLLLFEGPMAIVQAFAGLDAAAVDRGLNDPGHLPPGGRLTRVAEIPVPARTSGPASRSSLPSGFRGIYSLGRQAFVGDMPSLTLPDEESPLSLMCGVAFQPTVEQAPAFDSACLEVGRKILEAPGYVGVLFFPLSYWALMNQGETSTYERLLRGLPADRRNQLGASVYGVPRQPSGRSLQWLSATLSGAFSNIDLSTVDPDFGVEVLKEKMFSSVTLALPEASPALRRAALSRWVSHREAYTERHLWASVTNLREAAEVAACQALRAPFVSGPAVSDLLARPLGGRTRTITTLPA